MQRRRIRRRRRENFGTTTLPTSDLAGSCEVVYVDLISEGRLSAQNKNNWDVNAQADVSSTENVVFNETGITINATKIEDGMDNTCCANIGCGYVGQTASDYSTNQFGFGGSTKWGGCCEDSGTSCPSGGECLDIGQSNSCDVCVTHDYMKSAFNMDGAYPTKTGQDLAYCEPSASQSVHLGTPPDFCDMTDAGWNNGTCYEAGVACQCCGEATMEQGNQTYDKNGVLTGYDFVCESFGDFTYPDTNLYLEDDYNPCQTDSLPTGWDGSCTDSIATITSPPVVCGAQRYCSGQVETSSGEFGAGNFLLVQASIPKGPALWSAIWLKGVCDDGGDDCWPEAGELDLMEHGGMLDPGDTKGYQYDEDAFFSTIHCNHKIAPFGPADCNDSTDQTTGYYYDESFGSKCTTAGCLIAPKGFEMTDIEKDNWYGLYWSVDGKTVSIYTADSTVSQSDIEADPSKLTLRGIRSIGDDSTYNCSFSSDQKFNVIINLAIGGNIGSGDAGVDELDKIEDLASKTLKISAAIIYSGAATQAIFEGCDLDPITATPLNGDPFDQTFGTVDYSGSCLECASEYSPCCTGDCTSTAAGNWTCTDDCSGTSYCNQCQTTGFEVPL
jgi:hypothetical protein